VAGTHQSLAGISHASLTAFFKKSYHPKNMLIAIGGAFEPKEVVAEINSLLGDWQPATTPTFEKAPAPQTKARYYIEDRAVEQGHLCLALPGLSRLDPERYALGVLNTILGDGMSSRLFLKIREDKGLAYAVDSGLSFLQDTGLMVIYAGVDSQRAPETLQVILEELERLRNETVPAKELLNVRLNFVNKIKFCYTCSYERKTNRTVYRAGR
jgi:predicted Zn-dependent peptidase